MEISSSSVLSTEFPWPTSAASGISSKPPKENEGVSPQAVFLKALTVPLCQLAQQGNIQPSFQLTTGGQGLPVDSSNMSVIISPQTPAITQTSPAPTLTLKILNTLPILQPNSSPSLIGTPLSKSKNAGKHICTHCGRDCLKPSVLEKHIRSHTGERPFPCVTCGISFKTQSNLYKHRKTQTHVNNSKMSYDSDCGNCQDEKAAKQVGEYPSGSHTVGKEAQNNTSDSRVAMKEHIHSLISGNETTVPVHFSQTNSGRTLEETKQDSFPFVLSTLSNQKGMLKGQRSPTSTKQIYLQRQQESFVDKQRDSSPSERKLKKCESTDSGYLSHSDSADLQMFTGSPLHSLSESSMESENLLGTSISTSATEFGDKMGIKTLEERISLLISQNEAVVDDTHLDNVRPRKTALSKQGSIDLPMPYTFKDSFHFDMKSFDMNRKKVSLCSAKSIFTPPEKNKPLFFHSVPTQFSTTIDCMTLARSNSLPFVDRQRVPPDKIDIHMNRQSCHKKQPLDASFANLFLTNTAVSCTVDLSSSHPRGLVRQTAVDEIPQPHPCESHGSEEIKNKKTNAVDRSGSNSKSMNKKGSQKKANMFSHEKWQMYGDETFKKFYQKIKKNEGTRKSKQDASAPDELLNNEENWQNFTSAVKSGECHTSQPRPSSASLASNNSYLSSQVKCSFGIPSGDKTQQRTMEHQIPSEDSIPSKDIPNLLNSGMKSIPSAQNIFCDLENDLKPLRNQQTDISSSGLDMVLSKVNNERCKVTSVSKTEDSKVFIPNCVQSPSKSKKPKVETHKDRSTTVNNKCIKREIPSHSEYKNNDICTFPTSTETTDLKRNIEDIDMNRGPDTIDKQLFNNNILSSSTSLQSKEAHTSVVHSEKVGPSILWKSVYQSTEPLSTQKENAFSPSYQIKLHATGPQVTSSLEDKLGNGYVISFEERKKSADVLSSTQLMEHRDTSYLADDESETDHHRGEATKLTNVTISSTQVSWNDVHPCSSSVFTHCPQDKSCSVEGQGHPIGILQRGMTLDYTVPEKPFYSGGFVISSDLPCPDQILQCLRIESDEQMSTSMKTAAEESCAPKKENGGKMSFNFITNSSQDQSSVLYYTDPTALKPPWNHQASAVTTQEQQCPVVKTASVSLALDKLNIQSTKVTFSTLSTESKPTWCCLNRSVPLPAVQKKCSSIYSTLPEMCKDKKSGSVPLTSSIDVRHKVNNNIDFHINLTGNPDLQDLFLPEPSSKQKETSEPLGCSFPNSLLEDSGIKEHVCISKTTAKKDNKTLGNIRHKKKGSTIAQGKRKLFGANKLRRCRNVLSHHVTKQNLWHNQKKFSFPSHWDTAEGFNKLKPPRRKITAGKCGEQRDPGSANPERLKTDADNSVPNLMALSADIKSVTSLNMNTCLAELMVQSEIFQDACLKQQKSMLSSAESNDVFIQENNEDGTSFPEIKKDNIQQNPIDVLPLNPTQKVLHRSKTIASSLEGQAVQSNLSHNITPNDAVVSCTNLSAPRLSHHGDCGTSLCNSHELQGVVIQTSEGTTSVEGSLESKTSWLKEEPPSQSLINLDDSQPMLFQCQKKLSLEVMRKQTRVDYSDSSSDDEDRLVIDVPQLMGNEKQAQTS
ncbi:uncharacterized protein LOC108701776 isoform X2 [Xenopus laevis]|uniref:Uncharacterized protein LOC108701776 isoform X2 n=1 Tax=Xenopus laevis TaxID=8355 RepID=A0A8J1LRL0_XENLA|nr:uncharacterized protein LOC108701776 isoform X2 [Xenopus laevis]